MKAALFVGGSFDTAGGVTAKGIARWDGTIWHALGDGLHTQYDFSPAQVWGIAVKSNGVFATGYFTRSNETVLGHVGWFDGTTWHSLDDGLNDVGESAIVGNNLEVMKSPHLLGSCHDGRRSGTQAGDHPVLPYAHRFRQRVPGDVADRPATVVGRPISDLLPHPDPRRTVDLQPTEDIRIDLRRQQPLFAPHRPGEKAPEGADVPEDEAEPARERRSERMADVAQDEARKREASRSARP